MDFNKEENLMPGPSVTPADSNSGSAVNSLILDYYKKFGRKRDLEQYFSLSTAQREVKDTASTFWHKMKTENDSSDSGEKKSDSSQELCRISIRCSLPDPGSSQEEDSKTKSESVSPPIITEEAQNVTQNSDDESNKSYDNNSQKSFDVLDSSANKPHSPTSSVTSQRKLEWDSLADVGYANESDRKTSASSLSTLERLALKQHYSNNDTKLDSIQEPTAHSTPLDEIESKKTKKGAGKKSTKIYKKDVDYLKVNVPHTSDNNQPQSINVNLTKQISFNVEKDGKVTIDHVQKDVTYSPEKAIVETPRHKIDKEMQTSLIKTKDSLPQKVPVLISLNTLKRHTRRKKLRTARKKLKLKKKSDKENIPVQEKSGEQLSEAESFEYMPGHMYNQNQMTANDRSGNTAGNKSSLESSGFLTTDSNKPSILSFTKDLQKSIDILKAALHSKDDDTLLRKKLIKQVCERLIKTKYRDEESTSEFLSGLSFSSKKLGLERNHTTTSTSDNSGEKLKRPKKSILRNDKFNAGAIASTSQSAPNLPTASKSEKLVSSNLMKNLTTSNTDSDLSKEKSSSDNVFAKTSSQELYLKYLDALKREEAYKQHLKDKEMFLKQKLVCSDSAIKVPTRSDVKVNSRLKDLIKDLTRNNYDDGSGDASKLEGGPNSSRELNQVAPTRSQRSHSVFTLSSACNSDQNKKPNLKKRLHCDLKDLSQPGTSKEHYCCCPHHSARSNAGPTDSSQVKQPCNNQTCENRKAVSPQRESPRTLGKVSGEAPEDIKYVCLCNKKNIQDVPDNFMIFKCSKMSKNNNESSCSTSNESHRSRNLSPCKHKITPILPGRIVQSSNIKNRKPSPENPSRMKTIAKSSQTNFLLKMMRRSSINSSSSSDTNKSCANAESCIIARPTNKIYEATRWLQTEISINPKIPEPSLSDINIVMECADLVSEHCRNVSVPKSKKSSCEVSSCQASDTCRNTGSSKSSGTSKDFREVFDDDVLQNRQDNKTIPSCESDRSEKFTIPIQGTNMTLLVSIGSNDQKPKADLMIAECVGTERVSVADQETCLNEECSKAVQFDVEKPLRPCDKKGITQNQLSPRNVYTCLTGETDYMTYPQTSPVNERKPLRRANTDINTFCQRNPPLPRGRVKSPENIRVNSDTNKFGQRNNRSPNREREKSPESTCGLRSISKKASVEKETQYSVPNSPRCSCGCGGYLNDCVKHRKKNVSSQCQLTESMKCSCGCPGDKECSDKCKERQNSSSRQCPIQRNPERKPQSKRSENCNSNNQSPRYGDKFCRCGCKGEFNKCKKNCEESKKSFEKVESSRCDCGCDGSVNNCKKDSKNREAKCGCGCNSSIENCKNDGKEREPKCDCGCNGSISNCMNNRKQREAKCDCGCNGSISNCNNDSKEREAKCDCGCNGCINNCKNERKAASKECAVQKDASSSRSTPREAFLRSRSQSPLDNTKKDGGCQIKSKNNPQPKCDKPSGDRKTSSSDTDKESDPILDLIQNITKKFSKKDLEKGNRKKHYKEIMNLLNYLLQTDDTVDNDDHKTSEGSSTCRKPEKKPPLIKKVEKPTKKVPNPCEESSDGIQSTDMPGTSSDSATCKVLNKIKKECERYHQKRCKTPGGKKCEVSSSTSADCDQCRRVHHCSCRNHKCKKNDKKKSVAYNLILQQSESISEETTCTNEPRPLKSIIVKVPSKKKCKAQSPCGAKQCRSRSLPTSSEISSMEEFLKKSQAGCTVRQYLEKNRPDFIANSSERQNCLRIVSDSRDDDSCATSQLKMIVVHTPNCTGACNMVQCQRASPVTCITSQSYNPCAPSCELVCAYSEVAMLATMRSAQRDVLSKCLAQMSGVEDLDAEEIRQLAKDLGRHLRQKPHAPKFISERDMKKHSEMIYKSLPEVLQKKEQAKKENIKKTNLLMANIFKKNLQKKTLRGSVDISNYSPIIKI